MKSRRIFVTGGAGVIGRQLIPILEASGHSIIVGDLQTKPTEFAITTQYLKGDLNTLSESEFIGLKVDLVIHLAATFERTAETLDFWDDNFLNNIKLSHHILNLCMKSPSVTRLVFASSYLVYDSSQYLTNRPSQPFSLGRESKIAPRNLIGASKLYHEAELEYVNRFEDTGFDIAIVRIFRGYGLGSRDVISRWVRDALSGKEITVFDEDGMFDYVYCKDSALGIEKVALHTEFKGVLNLGTGTSNSVGAVVSILRAHFPDLRINRQGNRYPVESSQAETEHLASVLRWLPEFSLEQGIGEIISYERELFKNGGSN